MSNVIQHDVELPQDSANELIVQAIAGPETAARLGIPVGSVYEARRTVTPLDGSPATSSVITPEEAIALGAPKPPELTWLQRLVGRVSVWLLRKEVLA